MQHILSLESWNQEQENWECEPASNLIDAQLQLDAFQRQYNQFLSCHDELVARGRSVAKELTELDVKMFGSAGEHSAGSTVEKWVGQLEGACQRMKSMAEKKNKKLKSFLQFYLLQQKATKVRQHIVRTCIINIILSLPTKRVAMWLRLSITESIMYYN